MPRQPDAPHLPQDKWCLDGLTIQISLPTLCDPSTSLCHRPSPVHHTSDLAMDILAFVWNITRYVSSNLQLNCAIY